MEKLTEEMADRLLDALSAKGLLLEDFKRRWRNVGLLAPEETAYEKARRLWEEWKREPDINVNYEGACVMIEPLTAEIDRLNAEAWTEEEVDLYAYYCDGCWRTDEYVEEPKEWLSHYRQAKRKE